MNLENVSTGKNRKTKSILMLGIVLAVFTVACLVMAGAVTAADDSSTAVGNDNATIVSTENELKAAVEAGGNVMLGETISMSSQLDIKNTVVLDLNGCELRFGQKEHIYVAPGGDLTIDDSSNPSTGKIMGGYSGTKGGCIHVDHANLTLNAGTIRDGLTKSNGGGVYVDNGTFEMKGGTIESCYAHLGTSAGDDGGGVYMNGGTFAMSGGTISGNMTRYSGGGVYLNNGAEFTMTGGEISKNDASDANGGGVLVKNSTFTMDGGTISDNKARNYGAGVCLENGGEFTMKSGTISGNSCIEDNGAGVCVLKNTKFTMDDGIIENNNAEGTGAYKSYGGGVYVQGGKFEMNGGIIKENKAKNDGGGVLVCENGSILVSGDAKIAGNTKKNGKTVANVGLDSGATLTLDGSLSGEIRICNSDSQNGAEFGTATSGASGAENILSDDGTLCGKIDGGKLVWTTVNEGGSSSISGALTADKTTTTAATSPVPVLGVLAGLGAAALFLKRKN